MTDYPDFTVIARLKGEYAGAEKAVAVDVDGYLAALLYGTYAGANKKILVDVDGNVRMNLYAQDLEEMINRFKYGAPTYNYTTHNPTKDTWYDLISITGKGYMYSTNIYLSSAATHAADKVRSVMDGATIGGDLIFNTLNNFNFTDPFDGHTIVRKFDNVSFVYRLLLTVGWTFESTYKAQYYRSVVDNPTVYHESIYALV